MEGITLLQTFIFCISCKEGLKFIQQDSHINYIFLAMNDKDLNILSVIILSSFTNSIKSPQFYS